ncbi:MAG: hypothetical protein MSG64_18205 [Pyrinomonadaceae bacterium MAG19_C2-C3]|nr:hypothetical protein [Pyrinomonadaceae bacterium MAG19_C2-C3]
MKHTILLVSLVAILGIALAAASLPTRTSTSLAAPVTVQTLDGEACGTDSPDAASEAQTQAQIQTFAATYVPSAPGSIQIPVHFHVITHSNGGGVVTDAQIQEQINVINNSFAGLTGGVGTNTFSN